MIHIIFISIFIIFWNIIFDVHNYNCFYKNDEICTSYKIFLSVLLGILGYITIPIFIITIIYLNFIKEYYDKFIIWLSNKLKQK